MPWGAPCFQSCLFPSSLTSSLQSRSGEQQESLSFGSVSYCLAKGSGQFGCGKLCRISTTSQLVFSCSLLFNTEARPAPLGLRAKNSRAISAQINKWPVAPAETPFQCKKTSPSSLLGNQRDWTPLPRNHPAPATRRRWLCSKAGMKHASVHAVLRVLSSAPTCTWPSSCRATWQKFA